MGRDAFYDSTVYLRYRNRTIFPQENRAFKDFIKKLQDLCGWFLWSRWPCILQDDAEELISYAIHKHLETFEVGGRASYKTHLTVILNNRAKDLVRSFHYKAFESLNSIANTAENDNSEEFADMLAQEAGLVNNLDPSKILEGVEAVEILKAICRQWGDLPPYPWKRTVYLYLEWWAASNETSVVEFVIYLKTVIKLTTSAQTIRRHLTIGLDQLAKWSRGEDILPFE